MQLWHWLIVVLAAMLVVSFLAGRVWFSLFDFALPAYLAGIIGGFTALPVWELMRRMNAQYR